jgi:two-component system CheB/CheR fusion protein
MPMGRSAGSAGRTGTVLVVEDDPFVRDGLELLLKDEGYTVTSANDGLEVATLLQHSDLKPGVIVADYNLPGGRTGLEVIMMVREALGIEIPAVILTGDITTAVLRKVISADCGYLHKPVNVDQLARRMEDLLALPVRVFSGRPARVAAAKDVGKNISSVFLVDDDVILLESMHAMLTDQGHAVETFSSAEAFLATYHAGRKGCLVVDSVMPSMSGLELLERLKTEGRGLPSIMITGYGDIAMAIKAMKAGAMDFLEKPAQPDNLLASIERALIHAGNTAKRSTMQKEAAAAIAALTVREREVMDMVVSGLPNKEMAAVMDISQRTVEAHRAAVMKRTGAASLPDLIRLVMLAS